MKFSDLEGKIPLNLIESLSFDEMRPCQEKAIKAGLLENKNLIVCTPTGSGKTLVAEIAAVKNILEKKGKCVYIVPLKALASEKYKDFKKKYNKFSIKTAISIGDLDNSDPWLSNYDIIITTSEKMDSLIRHGAKWISEVSTIIVDEIHLINDPHRGPTLEILISLLKKLLPNAQLIGLSATIGNPDEIAEWLNARLIQDNWRPVRLYQGIFENNNIDFFGEKDSILISEEISDATLRLALDTINKGKQALIFCSTKKIAESTANKLNNILPRKEELENISHRVAKALSQPTRQCKLLSACIKRGIAFHHAGLVQRQKEIIEDLFRKEKIKIICCTPTLALGVDTPAFRVIMKSLKRYSGKWGMDWIPVLEYHQMTGRAGRP